MMKAHKLSRKNDPSTSKQAAESHVKSGRNMSQKIAVSFLLKLRPLSTSRELADMHMANLLGVDYHAIARRLPNLRSSGRAEVVTTRKQAGRSRQVWDLIGD